MIHSCYPRNINTPLQHELEKQVFNMRKKASCALTRLEDGTLHTLTIKVKGRLYLFNVERKLGEGFTGKVYKMFDHVNRVAFAIKDSRNESEMNISTFSTECKVVQSRPLVDEDEAFWEMHPELNKVKTFPFIQALADGDLRQLLSTGAVLDKDQIFSIVDAVREQMLCLYRESEERYVYTDMKLENVFYKCQVINHGSTALTVFLGDLSSAVPLTDDKDESMANFTTTFLPPEGNLVSVNALQLDTNEARARKQGFLSWSLGILLLSLVLFLSEESEEDKQQVNGLLHHFASKNALYSLSIMQSAQGLLRKYYGKEELANLLQYDYLQRPQIENILDLLYPQSLNLLVFEPLVPQEKAIEKVRYVIFQMSNAFNTLQSIYTYSTQLGVYDNHTVERASALWTFIDQLNDEYLNISRLFKNNFKEQFPEIDNPDFHANFENSQKIVEILKRNLQEDPVNETNLVLQNNHYANVAQTGQLAYRLFTQQNNRQQVSDLFRVPGSAISQKANHILFTLVRAIQRNNLPQYFEPNFVFSYYTNPPLGGLLTMSIDHKTNRKPKNSNHYNYFDIATLLVLTWQSLTTQIQYAVQHIRSIMLFSGETQERVNNITSDTSTKNVVEQKLKKLLDSLTEYVQNQVSDIERTQSENMTLCNDQNLAQWILTLKTTWLTCHNTIYDITILKTAVYALSDLLDNYVLRGNQEEWLQLMLTKFDESMSYHDICKVLDTYVILYAQLFSNKKLTGPIECNDQFDFQLHQTLLNTKQFEESGVNSLDIIRGRYVSEMYITEMDSFVEQWRTGKIVKNQAKTKAKASYGSLMQFLSDNSDVGFDVTIYIRQANELLSMLK